MGGVKVSGTLTGRKVYLEQMRKVAAMLPDAERSQYEATFTSLEVAPDVLDTLYLPAARVNDQLLGTWAVASSAVDAAAILVG